MPSFRSRCLLTATAVALIGGCADYGPPQHAARVLAPEQIGLQPAAQTTAVAWPAENWWRDFHDAQLSQLIDQAIADNPSLQIAQARIDAMQQIARSTRASQLPQLDANASASREHLSENDIYPPPIGGSTFTLAHASLDFSYEFDFWGRQRAELDAALQRVDVERAERASSQLMLSVAVADAYLSTRQLLAERALLATTVANREQLLALIRVRVQRGLASSAELEPATVALAAAQRTAAALDAAVDGKKHQLAALCGIGPDRLPVIAPSDPAVHFTPLHYSGIPADLLARRPDIIAQQLRVEAAGKDIVAAKADFYPNIDLSGYFGAQSAGLGELFKSGSRIWGVGPALHLPLFDRNALRAQLGTRYADYDAAIAQYNQTVLQAVRETADAGSALHSLSTQRAAIERSVQATQRLQAIADTRLQRGLGSRLDSLRAGIDLLDQQREALVIQNDQLRAALALIKALGGGYHSVDTARQ